MGSMKDVHSEIVDLQDHIKKLEDCLLAFMTSEVASMKDLLVRVKQLEANARSAVC